VARHADPIATEAKTRTAASRIPANLDDVVAEVELSDAEGFVEACCAAVPPSRAGPPRRRPARPDDREAVGEAVRKADAEPGIADISIDGAGHVLLPAGSRDELIA
jgi:hypothetical protein